MIIESGTCEYKSELERVSHFTLRGRINPRNRRDTGEERDGRDGRNLRTDGERQPMISREWEQESERASLRGYTLGTPTLKRFIDYEL